ncbi:hypothetical protein KP509_03G017200 [Ceratopteris richardii]|nr:hypothetical protein KP509_03G017200 [Ceratopteris richardii]
MPTSLMKHAKGTTPSYLSDADRNLDGIKYRLGDMVWAKVKSHPWWPGQLYDPALAAEIAMSLKKDSCFLVAFFGDSTFNWFSETELIPYEPNFSQKSKQTTAPHFVEAVEDSLDEVHKRVKSALTCPCSKTESFPENLEGRCGLLYDRQLHDIRTTFDAAIFLAAVKNLACSPFSFSQNMLKSTFTLAQTNAFRRRVSCEGVSEYKGTGSLIQVMASGHSNACDPNEISTEEVLQDDAKVTKGTSKVHHAEVHETANSHQECEVQVEAPSWEEKHRRLAKAGKLKKQAKDVSSKYLTMEKSKGLHDTHGINSTSLEDLVKTQDPPIDKGGVKHSISEKKGTPQPLNARIFDKDASKISLAEESNASRSLAFENNVQEGGQLLQKSKTPKAKGRSNKDISHLAATDSFQNGFEGCQQSQQRKLNRISGLHVNKMAAVVAEPEETTLIASTKKGDVIVEKVKRGKVNENDVLKMNDTKRANLDDIKRNRASDKLKVADTKKDKCFKESKRPLGNESIEVVNMVPRKIKKRKVLPGFCGEANFDLDINDHIEDLKFSDSLPSEPLQEENKCDSHTIIHEIDLEDMSAESAVPLVTGVTLPLDRNALPLEKLEAVLEDRLESEQENISQECDAQDALGARDFGADLEMQAGELELRFNTSASVQTKTITTVKERNQIHNGSVLNANSMSISERGARMLLEKKATVEEFQADLGHDIDNQTSGQNSNTLTTDGISDACVMDTLAASNLQSVVTCSSSDGTHNGNPGMVSTRVCQVEKMAFSMTLDARESINLSASNKVTCVKKRKEGDDLPHNFKGDRKKFKAPATKRSAVCQTKDKEDNGHHGLNKRYDENVSIQSLHMGLMSIASNPLEAIQEDSHFAVCKAFTSFRKVVYRKGVPCSAVSLAAVLDGTDSDKMEKSSREQSEEKCEDGSFENKSSKVNSATSQEMMMTPVSGSYSKSKDDILTLPVKMTKDSVIISEAPLSSLISMDSMPKDNTPLCDPRGVLDRFNNCAQGVLDSGERVTSQSSEVKVSVDERAMAISFPYGFLLPTDIQLREIFAKYGDLNLSLTTVDSKAGCAQVMFRHSEDAESALISMKKDPVFKNAHYWLKQRESERKRSIRQINKSASLKKNSISSDGIHSDSKTISHAVSQGFFVGKTGISGQKGFLHLKYGAKSTPLNASTSLNVSIRSNGLDIQKLDEIQPNLFTSPSILGAAESSSFAPSDIVDISEPLLALLQQLHDLVKSTGFVF